jgi:hypothetical protein
VENRQQNREVVVASVSQRTRGLGRGVEAVGENMELEP